MSSKHTPGPWGVLLLKEERGLSHAVVKKIEFPDGKTEPGICVAWMVAINPAFGDATANARLIAAAPDLLDACIRALRELKDGETTIGLEEDLEAAIARAEG